MNDQDSIQPFCDFENVLKEGQDIPQQSDFNFVYSQEEDNKSDKSNTEKQTPEEIQQIESPKYIQEINVDININQNNSQQIQTISSQEKENEIKQTEPAQKNQNLKKSPKKNKTKVSKKKTIEKNSQKDKTENQKQQDEEEEEEEEEQEYEPAKGYYHETNMEKAITYVLMNSKNIQLRLRKRQLYQDFLSQYLYQNNHFLLCYDGFLQNLFNEGELNADFRTVRPKVLLKLEQFIWKRIQSAIDEDASYKQYELQKDQIENIYQQRFNKLSQQINKCNAEQDKIQKRINQFQ